MFYCIKYAQESLKIIFFFFSNLLFVYHFTSQKRCCNKQQEKEDHCVETFEIETVDPGYLELGDFNQASPTYFKK